MSLTKNTTRGETCMLAAESVGIAVAAIQSTSTIMVRMHGFIHVALPQKDVTKAIGGVPYHEAVPRQPQISRCRRNPKHINDYGTNADFIHVL